MDRPAAVVSGLTGPAKALYVAAASQAMPRGTVVYVVPTDRDVEEAVADIAFFVAALEGLSAAAAEQAVLPFPSQEVDPYRGMSAHFGVASARARALDGIATGTARVVVASTAALMPRVSSPARLRSASLDLKPNQDISPTDLGELLVDAGFSREDPADEHGEFAIRGGILDVYPAGDAPPVRLEFVGDTIESLRTYDPATQRSIAPIDQLGIVPLRDQIGDDLSATFFDHLSRADDLRLIVSELDEVHVAAEKFVEQVQHSYEAALDRHDLPRTSPLDREWADIEAVDLDEDEVADRPPSSRSARSDHEAAPAVVRPPAELFADPALVRARLDAATNLTQLALDDPAAGEGTPAGASAHVRCQPAIEMHGRVPDWVAEIRRVRDEGETTLFVAATSGRAERTIELLKEYDVFAVPVERAEDARYAAVLVATGDLSRGFRLPDAGLQLYAEADVFEEERRVPDRRRATTKVFLSDLRDLKVGDLVVHVEHGIGVFIGLKQIGVGPSTGSGQGDAQEFLELRY